MKRAERQSVSNGWFTLWVVVGQYVSSFKQLGVLQVTHRAAPLIRLEHSFPKALLMRALLNDSGDVPAPCIDRGWIVELKGRRWDNYIIHDDRECKRGWIVANNIDRPRRFI